MSNLSLDENASIRNKADSVVWVDESTINVQGNIGAQVETAGVLELYELAPYESENDLADRVPVTLQPAPLFYHINSNRCEANNYETRVRLYSDDVLLEQLTVMYPEQWNLIELDIVRWEQRNRVTAIQISFRALSSEQRWTPRFQLDYVGIRKKGLD